MQIGQNHQKTSTIEEGGNSPSWSKTKDSREFPLDGLLQTDRLKINVMDEVGDN
jgi:hypothetical protein